MHLLSQKANCTEIELDNDITWSREMDKDLISMVRRTIKIGVNNNKAFKQVDQG
jgi:hypothetical protein